MFEGLQALEDEIRGVEGDFGVDGLFVAVEGEIEVVGADFRSGDKEVFGGALAHGFGAGLAGGVPGFDEVGQVILVSLRGAFVVEGKAVGLDIVEPDAVGGAALGKQEDGGGNARVGFEDSGREGDDGFELILLQEQLPDAGLGAAGSEENPIRHDDGSAPAGLQHAEDESDEEQFALLRFHMGAQGGVDVFLIKLAFEGRIGEDDGEAVLRLAGVALAEGGGKGVLLDDGGGFHAMEQEIHGGDAQHGLIEEAPADILARITPVATLAEALAGAVLVQENIRETLEAKRAIFAELDRLAEPGAILASSTSWLMASEFSADLPGRHRMLVGHPVNPPYLVPLVEIAPAPWTSEQAVQRAHDLYTCAGQTPVLLKKEITGFLLNRIQGAVLNEALNLYADGYASVSDLDKVLKDGLGLRWAFMGPFETIDLNAPDGVLDYAQRYGPTYRAVAQAQLPNDWDSDVLARVEAERRTELAAPQLAARARWRDNRLMALVAHKRRQADNDS